MEKGGSLTIVQGCISNPPIQMERESSNLRQPSRHLFIVNCWMDTIKYPAELLKERLDHTGLLPESQYGFKKDRRTIDIIAHRCGDELYERKRHRK